jgi:GntR family transcriptional regulator / MocR family aminotransferase
VLSGRLKGGARVPSSRVLAADHDVARITVVEAYDRLVAEGFLTSRPGSGLFVAAIQGPPKVRLVAGTPRRSRKRMPELRRNDQVFLVPERPLGLLPLSPGVPAPDHFPWRDWARITARLRPRRMAMLQWGERVCRLILNAEISAMPSMSERTAKIQNVR